ncbi:F-box/RNI-like/FBD-like domains-containing protein [Striga asiatica]|uniref:F-box/RNI-like/FBD-like domains-containing protein n=1 Tax=Striga asiatica TaxID=4170 RepID=A0A5A7R9T2_STRAF|nr:F-box/RNI-like/FBD-like domains-containing protein [Striga asiatica]
MASIDRLSALPDDIISYVLSFLPFKTSVATRALAARWRRLWAYAPDIQLTEDKSNLISFSRHRKFVEVLTKILSQCESHRVNTLRLDMYCYDDEHELEACLGSAFACNVKTLDLTLQYDCIEFELFESTPKTPRVDLRLNLFDIKMKNGTSKTLVDLRLKFSDIKIKNSTVCLPALKRLHLEGVTLDGSLENLISCCPVLEDFTVVNYVDQTVVCQCISSPAMKRLDLRCKFPYKLKIDTPALEYLSLYYIKPDNFSLGSMDSLIEARIVFVVDRVKPIVNDDLYSRSLVEFMGRFSNVKNMNLSTWGKVPDLTPVYLNIKFHNLAKLTVEGDGRFISYFVEKAANKLEVLNVIQYSEPQWEMEPLQLPMANAIMKLHNLTELELKVDWWFLTYFLEKADKLKVLTIRKTYNNRKRWLAAPLHVPNCLSSHLKIVQIHELKGTENELDMVRYLLKNAEVLERMELHCLAESIGRISSFGRGSETCEIVFHEYLESDDEDFADKSKDRLFVKIFDRFLPTAPSRFSGGQPKLNLQPRTLPVGEGQKEEVLKEKGQLHIHSNTRGPSERVCRSRDRMITKPTNSQELRAYAKFAARDKQRSAFLDYTASGLFVIFYSDIRWDYPPQQLPSILKEREYNEALEAFRVKNKEKVQLITRLMELVIS